MHVITYQTGDDKPNVVSTPSDDAEALDRLCSGFVRGGMNKVVLHSLNGSGVIIPRARFDRDGRTKITDMVEEGIRHAVSINLEADETETVYDFYCVKCKDHRRAVGNVVISDSGRRMAKGVCPVCGTKLNRILANLSPEEQESFDTPDDLPEPDAADVAQAEKTVKVAVKRAAQKVATPAVAIATANVAAETKVAAKVAAAPAFSDAVTKAPAKRAPRKVAEKTEIPEAVKDFQKVGVCPKCGNKVPVKEIGGLAVLIQHSGEGKDECSGSRMSV